MRIVLHITPDAHIADRVAGVLEARRKALLAKGVLYPRSPGGRSHARLAMAVSNPDQPDSLRLARGFGTPQAQARLRDEVAASLAAEVAQARPDLLILSAPQFGALAERAELARLRDLLRPLSPDITVRVVADHPARMALRRYAMQVAEGRIRPLSLELGLPDRGAWWDAALATRPAPAPQRGVLPDVQAAPHWLDLARLVAEWDGVFGPGATALHGFDATVYGSETVAEALRPVLDLPGGLGRAERWAMPDLPPAAWLERCRLFNEALLMLMRARRVPVPRPVWRRLQAEIFIDGPPEDAGALHALSDRFATDLAALCAAHPGLGDTALVPPAPAPAWRRPDPGLGFRATQYLAAFLPRIEAAQKAEARSQTPALTALSPDARRLLPPLAQQKFASLTGSPFAPHNRLGTLDETAVLPPYTAAAPRALPPGSTGRLIVACMKNEAPYILEWIAHHRAIGFDSFLIYTNGCTDPTDPLLLRLQELGIVHHRSNEGWRGKSPQQFALNAALRDPVFRAADWVAHIDVDEFINIRCGNGTLDDFLARAPGASHVAMTWRLFGNGGVRAFRDHPVTDQFDICAPRHCPKPHTAWGFKTLMRNDGAYARLSCHRPNQLDPARAGDVRWVNGNAQDMTAEVRDKGWRNSKRSIGYDLLQLNHYALRSADSFLVKRQRGRALHVDRAIGLNYWIRMDWTGARDVTIRRNMPRVTAEMDRLRADAQVDRLHRAGADWHRDTAQRLRAEPEFADLYARIAQVRLTETERAAYALAHDMEC